MNLLHVLSFLITLMTWHLQRVESAYVTSDFFTCLDGSRRMSIEKLCDDVINCPDLSDECLCWKSGDFHAICNGVQWQSEENGAPIFSCHTTNSSADIIFSTKSICDGVYDCLDETDEKFCEHYPECPEGPTGRISTQPDEECGFACDNQDLQATRCDGNITCENAEEEECDECPDKPEFCKHLIGKVSYSCKNSTRIETSKICDGINDCSEGEEELSCFRRFYCDGGSPVNIPENKVCDGQRDCHDSSDERNCSGLTHFYCDTSENVDFVNSQQVCDGSDDCQDASDECKVCSLDSAFSDITSLIKNKLSEAVTWISSILALFGNLVVASLCIRYMACGKDRTSDEMINKSLIFSLSLSDLLVGIYALSISIQHSLSKGSYCSLEKEWRSSVTCSALGTVLLLGLENLIFTLLIMSSYKLVKITSPTKKTSFKFIIIMISIAWILSILLAVIPLFPSAEDFFVVSIWYSKNPLFGMIYRDQVETLNRRLHSMLNHTMVTEKYDDTWSSLRSSIQQLNPEYTVDRIFGYYSTSGVCFPALFPDPHKITAWPYSLFLIIFNVIAITAIFVVCVIIFRTPAPKANEDTTPSSPTTPKRKANDKAEIIRIAAAAFLCWLPICILAVLQMAGVRIHNDAYFAVALLLTPIHSALKPFLYNDVQDFMSALKKEILTLLGVKSEKPKDEVEMNKLEEAQPALGPVET